MRRWLLIGLMCGGCATPPPGWPAICAHAPYRHWQTPPLRVVMELAYEHILDGEHGWHPTTAWINEQCQVLHPATRRPNRHRRWH